MQLISGFSWDKGGALDGSGKARQMEEVMQKKKKKSLVLSLTFNLVGVSYIQVSVIVQKI